MVAFDPGEFHEVSNSSDRLYLQYVTGANHSSSWEKHCGSDWEIE